jgi:hypothetical protein
MTKLFLSCVLSLFLLSACDEPVNESVDLAGMKAVMLKAIPLDHLVDVDGTNPFYTNSLSCITKDGELKNSQDNEACDEQLHCEIFAVGKAGNILAEGFAEIATGAKISYGRDGWNHPYSYFRIDFDRNNDSTRNPRIDSISCKTKDNLDRIDFNQVQEMLKNFVRFEK